MRNDAACKVVGISTMKVKMYDDIIRIFGNVRHVPSLKKNLITLGTLDANGYTYSSSGGKLKICKGYVRGVLPNNLYKLLGDTISGGTAISTYILQAEASLKYRNVGVLSRLYRL